jgi:hypothetical protein
MRTRKEGMMPGDELKRVKDGKRVECERVETRVAKNEFGDIQLI